MVYNVVFFGEFVYNVIYIYKIFILNSVKELKMLKVIFIIFLI